MEWILILLAGVLVLAGTVASAAAAAAASSERILEAADGSDGPVGVIIAAGQFSPPQIARLEELAADVSRRLGAGVGHSA